MSGRVVHFELPFDDEARAKAFYGDLFGWQMQDVPGMAYTLVTTGPSGDRGATEPGFVNGGMGQRGAPLGQPVVVIDVDDIDRTLAQVQERGGSVVREKMSVGPMGWNAYFADPEGTVVGLWQTAPLPADQS
ncbi:VOC family protein [Phycicoccus sp. Soil748]|uniref:VOC family protein n=1 Tax=Phycicoccus sp. Soil748 TaxID=1736397 RepID=UPI0007032039|nr:VOC family protein [Phycicoccus sp. Soil748]KRE56904.1 glyoxalase [Phycicoccus sp. Soil748]